MRLLKSCLQERRDVALQGTVHALRGTRPKFWKAHSTFFGARKLNILEQNTRLLRSILLTLSKHKKRSNSVTSAEAARFDVLNHSPIITASQQGAEKMSILPPEVHTALNQLLQALQSTDNSARTRAEEQLNTEWVGQRPDMLLMGLAEQMQGSEDEGVSTAIRTKFKAE